MIDQCDLEVGMQVLYVPTYVQMKYKNEVHKFLRSDDIEIGFVSSWNSDTVFCRFFWGKVPTLRTVANSEGCNPRDLFPYTYFREETIADKLSQLRADPEYYGWVEQRKEQQ